MKGKIFVGRSSELEALHKSLRRGSHDRAMLVLGSKGMGKSSLLNRFWGDLRSSGSPALWINLNRLSSLREPSELPAMLVQSLDGSTSVLQAQVASFAHSFGRAIFASEREEALEDESGSPDQRLSRLWTEEFLKAFPLNKDSSGKPLVYVAIDDVDRARGNLLNWFTKEFVSQWQDREIIDSFRFLASSATWPLGDAPLRFMEFVSGPDPLLVRLEPLTKQECKEFARKHGVSDLSGAELFAKTNGVPGQVEDELEMRTATRMPVTTSSESGSLPEGLTDKQKDWLARAACLPLLSAEGLSLFYDRKEATEVLNWLRYASTLTQKMKGRAIGLNPEIRQAALHWFRKKDPAGAQIALNRGERFTDFQARISSSSSRVSSMTACTTSAARAPCRSTCIWAALQIVVLGIWYRSCLMAAPWAVEPLLSRENATLGPRDSIARSLFLNDLIWKLVRGVKHWQITPGSFVPDRWSLPGPTDFLLSCRTRQVV